MVSYYKMNKQSYFTVLKQLHDICRDTPSPKLTGMDAYNEIMNVLYLRHMSDNYSENIKEKYNLKTMYDKYCRQEHIEQDLKNMDLNLNSNNAPKKELLCDKLSEKLLPRLLNRQENKHIGFTKIMGSNIENMMIEMGRMTNLIHKEVGSNITDGGQKIQKLINRIYDPYFLPLDENKRFNLNLFPYDALGEGFEKFMRDAGSTGGNWGQYFTNIQIIDYVTDKLNLQQNDTVCDPFAGSGSFVLKAVKAKVDPKNIYAHECDDKIYKFLKFNGIIAGLNKSNISKGDSYDYGSYLSHNQGKYTKIMTNPPYGSIIEILLSQHNDKAKFWSFMRHQKYTIKDSMGLALYAVYKMLKNGGVAGVVTDRGVLNNGTKNNSWQKKLRKYLIENTMIKEITLLPKGIFSYTSFDTAIIIFEKGKTTDKVVFNDGYFKDEDKGESDKKIYFRQNILTISLKDIIDKDWSLNPNDYIATKTSLCTDIDYKSIGEICEIKNLITEKESICKEDGKYPYFSSSILNHKLCDVYHDDDEVLIINKINGNGKCRIFYNNGRYCSSSGAIVFRVVKKDIIDTKYLFLMMTLHAPHIQQLYDGNDKKHLTQTSLLGFKIPIFSKDRQQEIINVIDSVVNKDYQLLDKIVNKLKNYEIFLPLFKKDKDYDKFREIIKYYNSLIEWELKLEEANIGRNKLLQRCFRLVKCNDAKIEDVCEEIFRGKPLDQQTKNNMSKTITDKNIYPYYGSNGVIGYLDTFLCDKNYILIGRMGSAGAVNYVADKFYPSEMVLCVRPKNEKEINIEYLNYYMVYSFDFTKITKFSGIKGLTKEDLKKSIISVPSMGDQVKVIKLIKEMNKKHSKINKTINGIEYMIDTTYDLIEMNIKDGYLGVDES